MSAGVPLASGEIEIGHHIEVEVLGFTVNADTVFSTIVAGLIVLGLGFWVRAKAGSGVPGKVQMLWEALISSVTNQVEASLGRINPFVVPLAFSLFAFILIANWLELSPDRRRAPVRAPTADVNLTYALALLVVVGVHIFGDQERNGIGGYLKGYFKPYPVMAPLTILIEELIKPFTLALRLFGNIFAGGIMLALIGLMPVLRAVAAERHLEAVRHVHRPDPGVHLRPADDPVLRHGGLGPRWRRPC